MTGFASYVFKFILNIRDIVLGCRLVTFVTGNILMLSVKFKTGIVVIKFGGLPVYSLMAPLAFSDTRLFELVEVDILMAT